MNLALPDVSPEELAALCEDMYETMYEADGVGLAAPQIGLNLRLFVMDCDGVKLVAATRSHQNLLMGSSPRGSLALLLTARAYAVLRGRDYVTPEDVKAVAHAALDHRVSVRPELWMNDVSAASVVDSVLTSVPTPAATGGGARTGFERP